MRTLDNIQAFLMGKCLQRDIQIPFAKAEGTDFLSKKDGFGCLSPEQLLAIITQILLSVCEFQISDHYVELCIEYEAK